MGQFCDYCKEWSIGFCLECGKDFCKLHEITHGQVCTHVNPKAINHFNKGLK